MRKSVLAAFGFAIAAVAGLIIYWRWFPRAGLDWSNRVLNPWLVERGWAGSGESEIGTIEHVGRRTGVRHLTPVHPVATADGFRIIVPLGDQSQWALNIVAAGHCRMQLHDTVYELDEPRLVEPVDVRELSGPARWIATRLGFKYLRVHRFGAAPGLLEPLGPVEATLADVGVPIAERAVIPPEAETAAQPVA